MSHMAALLLCPGVAYSNPRRPCLLVTPALRPACLLARCMQVIVFSDNVWALENYARALKRPYVYGKTSHAERTLILAGFKHSSTSNTVFLSKVISWRVQVFLSWCHAVGQHLHMQHLINRANGLKALNNPRLCCKLRAVSPHACWLCHSGRFRFAITNH